MTHIERAKILVEALPYIQKYSGKIMVIKYGGNAMTSETLKHQVMEDIVLLTLIGVRVVLVHGGGPEITELMSRIGKQSTFVNGLRVTDKESVEIVQMVLAGKVNKNLVNLIGTKGGHAIGLSGIDDHMITAEMKDEALGYVGKITSVRVNLITDLLDKGYIPVISTIGCDTQGNVYNINADTAAACIAGAMRAERMIMMTDTPGILQDKDDPTSLLSCIDLREAKELFANNVISGGMIPKVECCIDAIQMGVQKITIMDGRVPHAILLETLTDAGAGTMVVEEKTHEC
ncbi:MAG: acetylglutamate kinase [Eubacteriales bacterium]